LIYHYNRQTHHIGVSGMSDAKAKARLREIERSVGKLKSKNADERAEAAAYLGETAAADYINDLIDLYETDSDKGVKKAAAYALGQFKAIDRALSKGKQAQVEKLLTDVEENGKIGRRAPVGGVVQIIVILLVLFGILAAGYLFAPQLRQQLNRTTEAAQALSAPRRDRPTLIADARALFTGVRDDAQTLSNEYRRLLTNEPLTCSAFFNDPAAYVINPADASASPDIGGVIARLNEARLALLTAREPYTQACAGERALTTADSGAVLQPLTPVTVALGEIEAQLGALTGDGQPTLVPTTPPLTNANPAAQVAPLNALIEEITAPEGAAGLLVQYWGEAGTTGTTAGCTVPAPIIPDDAIITPADAAASPNLAAAVEQINTALAKVRNGWNQLAASCAENAAGTQARPQLTNAQEAVLAFGQAYDLLARVTAGEL
jgi:hypothetical protein